MLLAQGTPSAKVRFLLVTARSQGRSRRVEKGRFDPFTAPSANGRYLRTAIIADRNRGRRGWGKPTTPEPRGEERSLAGEGTIRQATQPLALRIALNTANGVAGMSTWSIP